MAGQGDVHAARPAGTKSLLRFITCGSVDDGKSTLIGRLLYESQLIFEDQLAAVVADSRTFGTQGGEPDLALLMDGLEAEREQGITIDVAYRYFATATRKFIVADTPGHEQYTRNMATGASTADAAVLLVDARKGVLTQTRRHAYIASLLGIRHLVLAVNKMDAVGYAQAAFDAIVADCRDFASRLGIDPPVAIPVSALHGDNVTRAGANMPWYDGPSLLALLESIDAEDALRHSPFRFPVQWINRPGPDFRGLAGTVSSGRVRPGDAVRALPSGRQTRVARIVTRDGDLAEAVAGQSVTLTLADELDVGRGDLLADAQEAPGVADQFQATLIWMHEEPMLPGRPYLMKVGPASLTASVTALRHRVNVDTLENVAARQLELNEIGLCNLSTDRPLPFDAYADNRDTGSFVLIDKLGHDTVGAGLINFALRRSQNVHWQAMDVGKAPRAALKGQRACVIWFTGLSAAGKSTIANLVEKRLLSMGRHTYTLDGDNVRHGLNRDLGFTEADRVENIRRVGEVARLMVDAGLIVLVSFISPFRSERRLARELLEPGEFLEVFVDAPLEELEKRDPKGLYRKARLGQLRNFTGIDSPYERPEAPELTLDTTRLSAEQAADLVIERLQAEGMLGG